MNMPTSLTQTSPHPLIGSLWNVSFGELHYDRLRREALHWSSQRALPICLTEWQQRAAQLRTTLQQQLHLIAEQTSLALELHGEILMEGYRIQKISFLTAPNVRMTALLYIPEGEGPFPAVLNCHGHHAQGKLAKAVQARGHVLAQSGIVTLSVDAAGTGERGDAERNWVYHGSSLGADLILHGDTLLGWQVRDNMRAIDLLQSLPYVDGNRIGVTGASGGGNQTMWVAAMDERVQAAIPVVSVGSFEAYVGRRNCICETLPGGLLLAEEWEVLGLVAPRPLLIINALHDQPAFGYEAMSRTAKPLKEIYRHLGAAQSFEARILDMTHGFHPPVIEAMLGWFKHHLCGAPSSSPHALPDWMPLPEEELICYPAGERPQSSSYAENRKRLGQRQHPATPTSAAGNLQTLARITGWQGEVSIPEWIPNRSYTNGMQTGAFVSPRGTPIPVTLSQPWDEEVHNIHLLLAPEGKQSGFVKQHWQQRTANNEMVITMDLPATGELNWEQVPLVTNTRFHDTARSCLWLGYTLVGEWAETIAALCLLIKQKAPSATLSLHADQETAFAALLARALQPLPQLHIDEHDTPASLQDDESMRWKSRSLAWIVPGFLQWGDLDDLRCR